MTSRLINLKLANISGSASYREGFTFASAKIPKSAEGNDIKINDTIYGKRRPLLGGFKITKLFWLKYNILK